MSEEIVTLKRTRYKPSMRERLALLIESIFTPNLVPLLDAETLEKRLEYWSLELDEEERLDWQNRAKAVCELLRTLA